MLQAVIAADKYVACALTFAASQVFLLGFFSVVIQGPLEFEEQAAIEMKAQFDECFFQQLQGDQTDVVADSQFVCIEQLQVDDAFQVAEEQYGALGLVGVCMQAAKRDLAVFDQFLVQLIHTFILATL